MMTIASELKIGDITHSHGNAPAGKYRITKLDVYERENAPRHMAKRLVWVWGVSVNGGGEVCLTRLPDAAEVWTE